MRPDLREGNVTFGWDYENLMKQISGAMAGTYQYDYQGRRALKTVGPSSTYLYDGLNLIQEAGAGGSRDSNPGPPEP